MHREHGARLTTHRTLRNITQGKETQRTQRNTEQILGSANGGLSVRAY